MYDPSLQAVVFGKPAARLFDVVIFDEASQVPLENAVPALFRAAQFIVVGDEMQLPPLSDSTPFGQSVMASKIVKYRL